MSTLFVGLECSMRIDARNSLIQGITLVGHKLLTNTK